MLNYAWIQDDFYICDNLLSLSSFLKHHHFDNFLNFFIFVTLLLSQSYNFFAFSTLFIVFKLIFYLIIYIYFLAQFQFIYR